MEQTITTECPNCHQQVTTNFHRQFTIMFEDDKKIARIGFLAEIEHDCNN
jgi:RNA polymerase subunit RPABC4/transcription elongation factor Spt4